MKEWGPLILTTLFISCRGDLLSRSLSVCELVKQFNGQSTVAIRSTSQESGKEVSTISAFEVFEDLSDPPNLEVERTITECDGKGVIHLKAIVRGSKARSLDVQVAPRTEKLRFYERGAKSAVVSADGTTVTRDNELESEGHAGILTNRPLNDEELFEVKLDKTTIKYDDSLGIGVTHHTPTSIDYLDWMPCGTIILYDNRIYEHGVAVKKKYGANIKTMKIGDRVGVMKKKNGDLHFFFNGDDQGVAKSNITYPVYGVLDVYGTAVQLSIVS